MLALLASYTCNGGWATVLWVVAALLAIVGVFRLLTLDFATGIVLLVLAALVGPGGVSLFC